jgi:uncharacterized circularly permuted ATP-grasp superfamily protein
VGDLFDGYQVDAAWDEVLAGPAAPHPAAKFLYDALSRLSAADLADRSAALSRAFRDQGITFSLSGEERPFPLDLVPRVVAAQEWRLIERGVIQRLLALEALLADLSDRQQVVQDGILPRHVVVSSAAYTRAAHGIKPSNGVRIHVSGIDVVRDASGVLRVLEDNLRTPSGISYVLENRRAMSRALPDLLSSQRVRPVGEYPARLLAALRAAAPAGVNDPTVVVLTPGVYNSAYFEHSLLARMMGVQLVEGRDLECRDSTLWMRTTAGRQKVDVVYRRIDDEFLDPLHFRADSVVGCPGLLNVARAGHVTIANAVGNGVADDKLVYTYVPDLIRYYLGEEPALPNVDTFRLEDPDTLDDVLSRLSELVLKPVDGSGGKGIVIGPQATDAELAELATAVRADPRGWIAQRVVQLSTSPTQVEDRLAPRHIDLRPFAVNDGTTVWVVPGGLTRVALPAGSLVVNSSQGGGSKDTWVLADEEMSSEPALVAAAPPLPLAAGGVPLAAGPQYQDQQQ